MLKNATQVVFHVTLVKIVLLTTGSSEVSYNMREIKTEQACHLAV